MRRLQFPTKNTVHTHTQKRINTHMSKKVTINTEANNYAKMIQELKAQF